VFFGRFGARFFSCAGVLAARAHFLHPPDPCGRCPLPYAQSSVADPRIKRPTSGRFGRVDGRCRALLGWQTSAAELCVFGRARHSRQRSRPHVGTL